MRSPVFPQPARPLQRYAPGPVDGSGWPASFACLLVLRKGQPPTPRRWTQGLRLRRVRRTILKLGHHGRRRLHPIGVLDMAGTRKKTPFGPHEGHELKLMKAGRKPLSMFLEEECRRPRFQGVPSIPWSHAAKLHKVVSRWTITTR